MGTKTAQILKGFVETLALIAYRQPATRGDIEEVRGVSVSTNIMRTLMERGWIREIGHREVPGRPALYATTRGFLDYFNLKSLDDLPPLSEVKALIEPVLFQESAEVFDAGDDCETRTEVGTKKTVVHIDEVTDAAMERDESDRHEGQDASKLNLQRDDDEVRPLAEVVKLPTPD
ncbi:MAG: hypothetical protein CM1200mP9_00510 [Gammaproteobacteria bacterium]|nr:MAG: hypothetical protein CM1200mP9_00510 [Gammaproteobacteria bacterium]